MPKTSNLLEKKMIEYQISFDIQKAYLILQDQLKAIQLESGGIKGTAQLLKIEIKYGKVEELEALTEKLEKMATSVAETAERVRWLYSTIVQQQKIKDSKEDDAPF